MFNVVKKVLSINVFLNSLVLATEPSNGEFFATKSSITIAKDHCVIPGLFGTFPRQIGVSMTEFETIAHSSDYFCTLRKTNDNRILLYGPPGNGKTAIAHRFAFLTKSIFKSINAAQVVTSFQNSGATAMQELFQEIETMFLTPHETVVLFFDEIDALGVSRTDQNGALMDTTRAMQALWQGLSEYEREPRIFFIFATNNIERLPVPFLNRFDSDKVIKIDNPTLQERKERIKKILLTSSIPSLNVIELQRWIVRLSTLKESPDFLTELAEMSERHFMEIYDQLLSLDNQLLAEPYDINTIILLLQNVETIIDQLKKQVISDISIERRRYVEALKAIESGFCCFCSRYISRVKLLLTSTIVEPESQIIDQAAEKTEGLSTRALLAITKKLQEHSAQGHEITVAFIDELCMQAQQKAKLEQIANSRTYKDELLRDLQLEEAERRKAWRSIEDKMTFLQTAQALNGMSCYQKLSEIMNKVQNRFEVYKEYFAGDYTLLNVVKSVGLELQEKSTNFIN